MSKSFKNTIDKTNLAKKSGIAALIGNTQSNDKNISNNSNTDNIINTEVRQTFIVNSEHLEKLKDFVHYKRVSGETFFTQKEAIYNAFELLFKSAKFPERPLSVKVAEKQKKNRK